MSQENFRLHVYTSSHDLIAEKPGGVGINKPIVRKCGILDNLKQVSSNVEFNYISDATKDLSLATCVHSKGFVHFMETAWDRWSKEIKSGLADTYFAPESYDKDPDPSIVPVFLPSQIRASDNPWQRPGKSVYGEICYYAMDRMTPIDGDTSNTLKHDMMINIAAIEAVIRKKQTQVYALTTQPGHHASRECYGGYCYINNSAIISKQLCEHYKRIAHLDIDYHAGNGTMAIFYSDPNILFASIHADPDYEYPYTSGFADQTGEGDAKGLTINVPLPGGTTWKQYEIELKKVLDQMVRFLFVLFICIISFVHVIYCLFVCFF